jgi:hypothetical protein
MDWTYPAPVLIGIVMAAAVLVTRNNNPCHISVWQIIPRALPGLVLFALIWTPLCLLVVSLFSRVALGSAFHSSGHWLTGVVIGLVLPHTRLPKGKISISWYDQLPYRAIAVFSVRVTEVTSLYVEKITSREARKIISSLAGNQNLSSLIDHLFEGHVIDIVAMVADEQKGSRIPTRFVARLPTHRALKVTLLLRALGHRAVIAQIARLENGGRCDFPTWPVGEPCRRRRVAVTSGNMHRRQLDNLSVSEIVVLHNARTGGDQAATKS